MSVAKDVHYFNLLPVQRPDVWLDTFFDLAVVSSLSAFNASNQMTTPGELIGFLGYYLVVASMWGAHIRYDARYETNDLWHRLVKCVHIGVFVYIGASSGGWDMFLFVNPNPLAIADERVEQDKAKTSFLTTAIACLAHRVLLLGQHAHIWWLGWRAGRRATERFVARVLVVQWLQCCMLIVCIALAARAQHARQAQLALLYGSVAVEFLGWGIEAVGRAPSVRRGVISQKYGSLSIMILGEGFTGMALVFQRTLLSAGLLDKSAYVMVGMALVVYCNIYGFVFSHFERRTRIHGLRELAWKWAQLTLHFVLLAYLQALLNVMTLSSFRHGMLETVRVVVDAALHRPDPAALRDLASYVDRVKVSPQFAAFTNNVWTTLDATNGSRAAAEWRDAMVFVYLTETAVKVAEALELGVPTLVQYNASQSINTTLPVQDGAVMEAGRLWAQVVIGILHDGYSGVLWLYPTAGLVLISAVVCSLLRGRINGIASWILHGFQSITGVALCILTLLCTGQQTLVSLPTSDAAVAGMSWPYPGFSGAITEVADVLRALSKNTRPMYTLVDTEAAVPVLLSAYTGLTVVTWAALHWVERVRGGVNDPNPI